MVEECNRIMTGTKHVNDWYFYHDALSLLTSKDSKEYMTNKTAYGKSAIDRWLLLYNDLNKGTPYHGRPVGNLPEFMPLDNLLNYNLQLSHKHHCAVTAHLEDTNPRKHSLSTLKRIFNGVKKIWEHEIGAPSPDRVVQDVYRAFEAHEKVYKADGKMVPGLANQNGHRYDCEGTQEWGDERIKSYDVSEYHWLLKETRNILEARKRFSLSRY